MKRTIKYTIIGLAIFFLWWTYPWIITAGGVGNIAIYYLDISKTEFEHTMDSVITHNPNIGIPDTNIYSLTGTGYEDLNTYIYLIQEPDTFVFRYKYSQYRKDWELKSNFRIALTHVGQFSEKSLKIDKDLYPFQDTKWENRFEKMLIECDLKFKKE
jgi:hypothetical protein